MKIFSKRFLVIALAVAIAISACSFFVIRAVNEANKELLESKLVRHSTGTVIKKELFECKEENCFYVSGYGDRVEMKRGEKQQRIYYQIDNFENLNEPRRSGTTETEKERVDKYGLRFTYAVSWFDDVQVGEKVDVGYRAFSNGQIQVWFVDRVKGRVVIETSSQ